MEHSICMKQIPMNQSWEISEEFTYLIKNHAMVHPGLGCHDKGFYNAPC